MNLDGVRYIGLFIGLITFFSICRRFYLDWRTDKWRELTGFSWDETYETLENVLLAFENTEFSSHITNGDVECGHFFIEVDHIKKESNTFYYLKTVGTLNSKSKIIARYETLEDFISEFPTISSLYVKQGKTENRIDKLMEDF